MTKEQLKGYRDRAVELARHASRITEISHEINYHLHSEAANDDALIYTLSQLSELREHHREQMRQCNIDMRTVENFIDGLPTEAMRTVVSMRYMDGVKNWQLVADAIRMSVRQTQRIHGYALTLLE